MDDASLNRETFRNSAPITVMVAGATLIGLCGVAGALAHLAEPRDPKMAAVLGSLSLAWLLWTWLVVARTCVVADGTGLEVRGLIGARRYGWNEIARFTVRRHGRRDVLLVLKAGRSVNLVAASVGPLHTPRSARRAEEISARLSELLAMHDGPTAR